MTLLAQSDPQAAPGTGSPGVPPTADDVMTEPAGPGAFPGFADRLVRAWERFRGKPGTFLLLSFLLLLTPIVFLIPTLFITDRPGLRGLAALILLAASFAAQSALAGAMAAASAFKVRTGKAIGVGFNGLFSYAGIVLLVTLALMLPSLLIVPGIIMGLRVSLAFAVATSERRRGIEALARSRDLVTGTTKVLLLELFVLSFLMAISNGIVALLTATGATTSAIVFGLVLSGLVTLGRSSSSAGRMNKVMTFLGVWSILPLVYLAAKIFMPGAVAVTGALLALALGIGPILLLECFWLPFFIIYLQVYYEDCVARSGQEGWVMHPRRSRGYGMLAFFGLLMLIAAAVLPSMFLEIARGDQALRPPAELPSSPTPQPIPEVAKEPTPEERDLARYGDVNTIKIALSTFQGENKAYPDTLVALAPKYLSVVPADPLTKAPYGYVKVGLSYKLSFILESGVFALAKGEHFLTPNGFDVEPIQSPPPTDQGETTTTTVPGTEPPEEPPVPENPLPEEQTPTEGEPQPTEPPDADKDGLADDDERLRGTDPANSDSDGDSLSDGDEVSVFTTDPLKADADGDGYDDADEIYGGFNPNGAGRLPDGDSDGLADVYESAHGLDAADKDMDNDGLSDGDELRVYRTDPLKADTDGDSFTDPQELQRGFEPNGPGQLTAERKSQIDADGKKYGLF